MFASNYLASVHREYGGLEIGLVISRLISLLRGRNLVVERRHPTAVRFSLNPSVRPVYGLSGSWPVHR